MAKAKKKEDIFEGAPAGAGHNQGISHEALKSYVQRITALKEEKDGIAADIRDIFAEAKGNGFDTKVLRLAIKEYEMDAAEREERRVLLELYLNALGIL